ncbi:hypothetical protein MKW92_049599, partial [Papaver armeniacum]
CTNFLGMEQALNCKQFPNFPYGKLNAKMKAPSGKTSTKRLHATTRSFEL